MLKVENVEVWGFDHAIRGMRNPMNSWEKSDSRITGVEDCMGNQCSACSYFPCKNCYVGPNDLELMRKLYKAGTEHRKYLRQIFVSMDIIAPLYWWKEFDTYKIGTVENSCSTMHKIHAKEFTREDFSHEHLIGNRDICWKEHIMSGPNCDDSPEDILDFIVDALNTYREKYLVALKTESETGLPAKDIWWQMIQLLPSSYNQRRTVTMTYENVVNIIGQRYAHKLDEWRVDFVPRLRKLPYIKTIMEG